MNFIIPYQYNKSEKTHIESTILTDTRLSDKSVRFLLFITNLINFNALKININYTNISYRQIEKVLKYSRNKIKNCIDELLKTEYLHIERAEGKKSKYFLRANNFKNEIVHNLSITQGTGINSDTTNTTVNNNGSINSDTTTGINSDTTTGINSDTTQPPSNPHQDDNRHPSTHQYTKFSTPKESVLIAKQEKKENKKNEKHTVFKYYKDFMKNLDPEFNTVTLLDTNKITYKVYYHTSYKYDYKSKKPYPVFKVNIQIGSEVFSVQDYLEHTQSTDTPIQHKYSFIKSFIEAIEKKDKKATEGYLYNFKSFHRQYLQELERKKQEEKTVKNKAVNELFQKAGVNFENFADPSVQSKQEQLHQLKRSHPEVYERVKRSIKIDERRLNISLSHDQRTIRELNLFKTYLSSENIKQKEKQEDENIDEFDNIEFEPVLARYG